MNKKIIIAVLNVIALLLIATTVSNTAIIEQIDTTYLNEFQIDSEVLKTVIRNTKLIMYTIPTILLVIGLVLLIFKKSITFYISLFSTVIAILIIGFNIATFDSKILSESLTGDTVLNPEVELVLIKLDEGLYQSKGEYIENIIDIIG